MFFSLPIPPSSSPPPYLPKFIHFLFLSKQSFKQTREIPKKHKTHKTQIKTNKQMIITNKTKMSKQSKWNKRSIKIPLNPFCIGQLLLGTGLPRTMADILREMTMDKTVSLCEQVSVAGSFLARGGTPCPLPQLV